MQSIVNKQVAGRGTVLSACLLP